MSRIHRAVIIIALLLTLALLGACSPTTPDQYTAEDGQELLFEAIDNLRTLRSFRMDVTQGGTPYRFFFQLGPSGVEFVTVMSRAEGAYIAPDQLFASARINVSGLFVNVGLFATSFGQWLKPLSSNWIEYEYAPGFDPRSMMADGDGFRYAIENLYDTSYEGLVNRDGRQLMHVRGMATNQVVNSLLFGLLVILEDRAFVDVYIDPQERVPAELLLTLPDTATENTEDTFWRIEIFDTNEPIEVDRPPEVPDINPESIAPEPTTNWTALLLGISGVSALLGLLITPVIYYQRGQNIAQGALFGAVAGALGSLIFLLPLWLFAPQESVYDDDPEATRKTSTRTVDMSGVNPWVVMAFIAIPVFVGSLDLTVVSAFLPKLVAELGLPFDTGLDDASWVVTSYLLAYTISLTFTGRLSDLVGRRRVYVVSLVVFIIGSIWVAIAHTWPTDVLFSTYRVLGLRPDPASVQLQVIIAGRVVEALGAGALVPVSLALVGDIFPPERRARPLGLVAAMDTLGWVLGPVYGGFFMQLPVPVEMANWMSNSVDAVAGSQTLALLPWQGLFWMNVPLTLLSLVSVLYALRKVPMLKAAGRFDILGTLLIGGALAAMSIGLGSSVDLSGGTGNIEDLQPLPEYAAPLLLVALVFFLGFLFVENRSRFPLVNLNMFRRRNLSAAALVNLLVGYCLFIGLVSVPILVNLRQPNVESLTNTALQVGALLSTLTLPMAFAAVPGGWLADRLGIRTTILTGLGFSVVGFLLVWQTWTLDISNVVLGLEMALVGIGIGLTFSPVSTAIINSAYDEERGVAGAIVLILRLIGMTVSVSTLSSIMFYRVNALAAEASNAVDTLDIDAFQNAYVDAAIQVLGEMGLIGAVLSAIAILPALWIAQKVRTPDESA